MNTHPSEPSNGHHPAPGPNTPPVHPSGGAQQNSFFAWLRQLGLQRSRDRWIGGVAGGIAQRTGLDPILVRGLVILLSLFGIGVVLYGVAWALLPEPDGRIHLEQAIRGTWTAGMTGALTFTILGFSGPGLSFLADDGWLGPIFWGLFWVAAVILVIYWATTRNGRPGPAGTPPGVPGTDTRRPAAPAQPAWPSAESPAAGPSPEATAGFPPAAGYPGPDAPTMPLPFPSGATAYPGQPHRDSGYGYMPAPRPQPAKAPSTSPPASWAALICGFALLAAGTLLALDYTGIYALGAPVAVALASAGVVLGLGVAALGAAGRSSGIAGGLGVLALIGALLFSGNYAYRNLVVANESTWSAEQSSSAAEGYSVIAADGALDLRGIAGDLKDGDVIVPVSVAAGDLTILVPDDVPVSVYGEVAMGEVELEYGGTLATFGGLWVGDQERQLNPNATGNRIVIQIKGVASHVLVTTNESSLNQ
ncbi:PspC domain-containing protein [Arthrobacter sp. zg-Y916]|uniref:PspC domain-containing protein n=1 Tax=Arthrobacter sp. zg-Y916 TaxID=2894190 RepID=UPI001E624D4A|nr:PspC domain-containing protein [Arthrobacter sp. zg-Y916]MCC9192599.1 PspC domain-containing protein [Arthrobacter sp. zg-Y916]